MKFSKILIIVLIIFSTAFSQSKTKQNQQTGRILLLTGSLITASSLFYSMKYKKPETFVVGFTLGFIILNTGIEIVKAKK